MAQDIFIKIDGIDGESQDASHKNEIEVQSWNWIIKQQTKMHSSSGGGAGKATVEDLAFLHQFDRASPNLTKYCLLGKPIPEVKLVVRKAGGNPLEYLKITMNDVIVTEVLPSGSNDDDCSLEEVRLSFSKVRQEYTVQNAQGGSGGVVTGNFDIRATRKHKPTVERAEWHP